ncbi:glycoside hydrolase family 3 N-terminal domain-containing protein [Spongiactinospora sp. TRM90649]|uniref:glycoside hydrolase family 3 protein n=1 Tax=Spongiactinospora sp. TRM90649 TaxID=3031114 RepID=UPI0023F8B784|nr:glycoside hydrolase family 3 N-terminal domain-containing protein [Spongiactinospora sp. TRM90649]MDF5753970.1 glycoside hydrolase family 3 N-terminal domain-containing protein [Spongiactinospora sp. TRM90649]
MSRRDHELLRLADEVLLPGFTGTTPPDWLRRRLGDGLAGVVLFSRNIRDPEQVAALTAALRAEKPDALVGIDEESGEVTRLEVTGGSTRPGSFALGVVDDVELTEAIARDLGRDLAAAGVTINFAPSADVNSNPDNPVIGLRSFGADPELVARHTVAAVRGMQSAGVAACAKHYPGHGDTSVDSHHAVPYVSGTVEELWKVPLLPFRAAIEAGVRAVMTGHLLVPALDPERPSTLSHSVLTGLLRDELGFTGLVVTDAIEMSAVSGPYGIGGASAMAIAAGADAICIGGEHADEKTAEEARDAIADAVIEGRLCEERLAEAARRVRELAAWSIGVTGAIGASNGDASGASLDGAPLGLQAARRALQVTRRAADTGFPLRGPALVVEFAPEMNMAIDKSTPWGIGGPLAELLPGTTATRLTASTVTGGAVEAVLAEAGDRPMVLVVRDAHRHEWQMAALGHLLAARPDSVVVEMGLPGRRDLGAVHIATHGSARVCGIAAAEVLCGHLDGKVPGVLSVPAG